MRHIYYLVYFSNHDVDKTIGIIESSEWLFFNVVNVYWWVQFFASAIEYLMSRFTICCKKRHFIVNVKHDCFTTVEQFWFYSMIEVAFVSSYKYESKEYNIVGNDRSRCDI